MSFWGLYASCMLFFGILQHYSSRICMCVCWIWKKMRRLSIFYTYSAIFFSRRRRAVLPTAVSLSVQLILFTSFPHVRGTRCQNAQNLCIYFLLLLKSWKLKQKYNLPFSLLALAGKGGKGKVWWTRAAETIHQSSAHPSPLRRRNTTKRLNAYRNSKNATCATTSVSSLKRLLKELFYRDG